MIAILFSDLHLHVWSKYNEDNKRLRAQKRIVTQLYKTAYKENVPIYFMGDWFHMPESLSNALISEVFPFLVDLANTYPTVVVYGINGNHDFSEQNNYDRRSPGYITTIANMVPNWVCLDFDSVEFHDYVVHGVPYVHGNKDYPRILSDIKIVKGKKNILINHCDYAGQKDVGDVVVGKGDNIEEEQLKKFDLVWSGHIHKGGLVRNNIYSIGSPVQTRTSDMNHDFGYWILKDNWDMKFVPIDDAPKFRYYEKESDKDNDYDMWMKKPQPMRVIEGKGPRTVDLSDKSGIIEAYVEAKEIPESKADFLREVLTW